jgi:pre-mRNA-splicing factor SYF2
MADESPKESPEPAASNPPSDIDSPANPTPSESTPEPSDRLARFKALQARQKASRSANLKDTKSETARLATDPALLMQLERRRATASHKLLKAETADFERKRAWDWTAEEAAAWDRRLEKKAKHKADTGFADYTQDARKVYKRQLRDVPPDVAGYEKQKREAIERAAASGGLEIVETEDGELIAVDRDGSFYSTAESTEFVNSKPEKAAVDRLVEDIRKAEAQRMKKRRERGLEDDTGGDVTYINQKVCAIGLGCVRVMLTVLQNKQFNDKLARFYNKYTSDIRDSFERGTAI